MLFGHRAPSYLLDNNWVVSQITTEFGCTKDCLNPGTMGLLSLWFHKVPDALETPLCRPYLANYPLLFFILTTLPPILQAAGLFLRH